MITDSADVGLPDRCPAADRRPPDAAGPIEALLTEVWLEAAKLDSGELATYIPQLAHADPRAFGIALATLDGRVYSAGELVPFTIQSVSKPFVYALALADCGLEAVLDRVGVEPTGNAFNTISVDNRGRPSNPMVNAGAIDHRAGRGRGRLRAVPADSRRPVRVRRSPPRPAPRH